MTNKLNDTNIDLVIKDNVKHALAEDVGSGDITAQLISPDARTKASITCREYAVVCGRPWVDEVFMQVDPEIQVHWFVKEGSRAEPDQVLVELEGKTRSILTAERTALNFLQLMSGIAKRCRYFADMVKDTNVKLLDTRKTIPGLRIAQKYAVNYGGCFNHRIGLYDAFLIKENHINGCGGIINAVAKAKSQFPGKPVEVEVESIEELKQALNAGADIIMLDNFTPKAVKEGVIFTNGRAKLEASGNISDKTICTFAETGVDYISMGTLTKDCRSIDLSLRLNASPDPD